MNRSLDQLKIDIENKIKKHLNIDDIAILDSKRSYEEVTDFNPDKNNAGYLVRSVIHTYFNGTLKPEGLSIKVRYNDPRAAIKGTLRKFDPSTIIIGENLDDPTPTEDKITKLYWRVEPQIVQIPSSVDGGKIRYAVRMRLGMLRNRRQ